MKTKVDHKFALLSFLKRKGISPLMRGVQPVVYGATISSFIYFVLYKNFKESIKYRMDKHGIDKTNLSSVFLMSAGASTFANFFAVSVYYPYDLIKTRMQIVGEYKYKNIVDAIFKIHNEDTSTYRLQNFFKGYGLYSVLFISFVTLEFSIYETIMMYFSRKHSNGAILSENLQCEDSETLFEHHQSKKMIHILFASSMAGAIGGFLTNPLEYLTVNKQAHPHMKIKDMLKQRSIYDIVMKGSLLRTVYYSTQSVLIFFLLEKCGAHLN